MADREIGEVLSSEGVDDKRPRGLGGVAHAPMRLADPIAHLGMGLFGGTIADAADQLAATIDSEGDTFVTRL